MPDNQQANQCSVYGENWAESMPENMVDTAIENGKISESCKEVEGE
jgi:hypothetical protein